MPKFAVVPSHLMGGPENPGRRWDAAYVMILADLLNPQLSIEEATDLLERHLEDKKIKVGDLWRTANTESAVRELGKKFGLNVTHRVKQRFTAVFMELLRRHKAQLRKQAKGIEQQLDDLDVRFQAEALATEVLEADPRHTLKSMSVNPDKGFDRGPGFYLQVGERDPVDEIFDDDEYGSDSGEGPWPTYEDALIFFEAEVGVVCRIVYADKPGVIEPKSDWMEP